MKNPSTSTEEVNVLPSETTTESNAVAIVGGGLAGSMMALMLVKQGYVVHIFEQRADSRNTQSEGKSINLGLSKRGMEALAKVELLDKVLESSVPIQGRVIHQKEGDKIAQPYGKNSHEILHSVDRTELIKCLLDEAENYQNIKFHFNHKLIAIDKKQKELHFETQNGVVRFKAGWVVGADGAFSKARKELQRGVRADFQQEFLQWGYKELSFTPSEGEASFELEALHVWPRGHCLIVTHPNRNGSHTLTLFLPFTGEDSFESCALTEDARKLFMKYFSDLESELPSLLKDWEDRPVGSLITTRTSQWSFGDWGVLVGDSCHAQYPFLGQGMNSAFEDCHILANMLEKNAQKDSTFASYEATRKPHTDVLAEMSKDNFLELRKGVQSKYFHFRKSLNMLIHKVLPNTWLPLYFMIAHTTMPYLEAKQRAERQELILDCVLGSSFFCVLVIAAVYML